MSQVPADRKYTESHEWVFVDGDIARIGISDHAQAQLGDMVFIELPEVDSAVVAGDEVAVVESVKTASDVYAPLSGTIVEVNEALEDAPEMVNSDPYEDGWIFAIKMDDPGQLEDLKDAAAYSESLDE
ncbi:MAG: glycine cleavage system protein GcvH [bacterium]